MKVRPLVRLEDVADDDNLTALIDQLQRDDPGLRRLHRRILRLQRQLRARVDDGTWRVYLELEATVNERGSRLLNLVRKRC